MEKQKYIPQISKAILAEIFNEKISISEKSRFSEKFIEYEKKLPPNEANGGNLRRINGMRRISFTKVPEWRRRWIIFRPMGRSKIRWRRVAK